VNCREPSVPARDLQHLVNEGLVTNACVNCLGRSVLLFADTDFGLRCFSSVRVNAAIDYYYLALTADRHGSGGARI
jgi:hypothetical protein